jgi:hypothetical protein
VKKESACRAAVDAIADHECAIRFDTPNQGESSKSAMVMDLADNEEEGNVEGHATGKDDAQHVLPVLLQIGRKSAITKEQQENLRRARAEKLKRISRDRNLFFIWVSAATLGVSNPY